MVINDIEIYKLTPLAELKYRQNCFYGTDSKLDAIERKLTAQILNATKNLKMPNNKWKYSFGSLDIFVDENNMEIYDLNWITGGHVGRIESEIAKSLKETYLELGLSKNGNAIIDKEVV